MVVGQRSVRTRRVLPPVVSPHKLELDLAIILFHGEGEKIVSEKRQKPGDVKDCHSVEVKQSRYLVLTQYSIDSDSNILSALLPESTLKL